MSEKEKKELAIFAAALEEIPEVKAFADGYKAGREAAMRAQQEQEKEAGE